MSQFEATTRLLDVVTFSKGELTKRNFNQNPLAKLPRHVYLKTFRLPSTPELAYSSPIYPQKFGKLGIHSPAASKPRLGPKSQWYIKWHQGHNIICFAPSQPSSMA
ncbi:hypothetical protein AVEN_70209-1 [Araneus ventricosus]|uniref:Uncharacterized protein n=1 Tax=Araneus ventricosus TaxID=182803 RepID=A0A4Y2FDL4_ARAVE|nr:hypothetical protein AVEN_70209-1 [Araneus ventricosus]